MKYVCDACERLVEPRGTAGEAPLALICSRCGEPTVVQGRAPIRLVNRVPAETVPSSEASSPLAEDVDVDVDEASPAPLPPEARCPKCTHPRSGRACPKCGLVFALYRPEKGGELERVEEELGKLLALGPTGWTKRLALVGPEQLMTLARACRLRLADVPADATARSLLDDISSRSLAQVMALAPSKRPEGASSEQGRLIAYGAVALGLLTIASLVAYTLGHFLHE